MTQEERNEIIDNIIDDLAWANPRRVQVPEGMIAVDGIEYDAQETLDKFRDALEYKLARIIDKNLPNNRDQYMKFIFARWAEFIQRSYGIIQTWEEYKNSDAYRMA